MNQVSSNVKFIRASGEKSIHRAGWVIINPYQIIENGCVEVENGLITGAYKASVRQDVLAKDSSEKNTIGTNTIGTNIIGKNIIDHGPGVIMPSLVNAHLHLELSALKNALSFDKGFAAWVQELLEKREALEETILIQEAQKAAKELESQGLGYIGEISTLGLTKTIAQSQKLSGVWFHEFLGSASPDAELQQNDSLSLSMAGHGPHTTNPFLLQAVKQKTQAQNLPFSIHLAESDEESEFISGKKGQWSEFLASRGIDTSSWPIGSKSPVQYLDDLNVLDSRTLAVHLLNIDDRDLDILARTNTRICLCPRSNFNLHKKLPDIGKMFEKNLFPALGTDSLASCDSLNIFDEMAFVRIKFSNLAPAQVLSMATINGARALGLECIAGSLDKGKKSEFIYVDVNLSNNSDLLESLTFNEK
jgi:cytosine/adenosine deaminase-related metal-dependent hydrolase